MNCFIIRISKKTGEPNWQDVREINNIEKFKRRYFVRSGNCGECGSVNSLAVTVNNHYDYNSKCTRCDHKIYDSLIDALTPVLYRWRLRW